MSMYTIKLRDLNDIRDLAIRVFHDTPSFPNHTDGEMQVYCILAAATSFLASRGVSTGYEVAPAFVQEDSNPVDEGGLEDPIPAPPIRKRS